MEQKQKTQGTYQLKCILALALWPIWLWYGQRLTDQSDEPLGVVALITLVILLWKQSQIAEGKSASQLPWLTLSLACLVLYTATFLFAPKLLSAIFALAAIGFFLNHTLSRPLNLGHWGLLFLSLPLIASLNFYLGYPLRLAVAQVAVSLLSINGFPVSAEGTSLLWHNQSIEIDAPCSGIKMLWTSTYLAALLISIRNSSWGRAAIYLVLAIASALLANILRVTSLFYLEAGIINFSPAAVGALPDFITSSIEPIVHSGTGLTAFLLVVLVMFFADKRFESQDKLVTGNQKVSASPPTPPTRRHLKIFIATCAVAAIMPFFTVTKADNKEVVWPTTYQGQTLQEIPLSQNEAAFAANFPGQIAMFKTGNQTIILRRVFQATRQLHPAADCYRASGFTIKTLARRTDKEGHSWNVLQAAKGSRQLEVKERIYNESGQFTDVSHWFWAAFWGQSKGPWWSITTVTAVNQEKSH